MNLRPGNDLAAVLFEENTKGSCRGVVFYLTFVAAAYHCVGTGCEVLTLRRLPLGPPLDGNNIVTPHG